MSNEPVTTVIKKNLLSIKQEPMLTNLIKMRNVGFLLLGIWLGLFAIAVVIKWIFHIKIFYLDYLLLNPNILIYCGIFLPLNAFVQMRSYKKVDQKRQRAAQGEKTLLANQQPIPGAVTLLLPLKIRYQTHWTILLVMFGVVGVGVALIFGISIWLGLSEEQLIGLLLYFVVLTVILIWSGIIQAKKQLIADETGLSMQTILSSKIHHIPWQEARLFAIDAVLNETKRATSTPYAFELASNQEVIRWQGVRGNARGLWPLITSESTPEQYAQQLQTLNALIVEKTGLPLYDLRK